MSAHAPDARLKGGVFGLNHTAVLLAWIVPAKAKISHQITERSQAAAVFSGRFRKFNQQYRLWITLHKTVDNGPELRDIAAKADHVVIDQFNSHGAKFDDVLRRIHRSVEGREMTHAQCLGCQDRGQF